MDRLPYEGARYWRPRLSPFWIRVIRPLRIRRQRRREGLHAVTVEDLEHVRQAVKLGHGILITPNHAGHVDAFILLAAADQLALPFYYLVAWQVLQLFSLTGRWILQRHGCFTVDRERHDLKAFKKAVEILQSKPNPLVVFPEGEVYHNCDRLTPFREGAAAIALAAAHRAQRSVVCIPAAIVYEYIEDPTAQLNRLMDVLERRLHWRPRPELPLAVRLRSFADALLCLREQYYLGQVQTGGYTSRIDELMEVILTRLEKRQGISSKQADVPGRVSRLRHQVIQQRESLPARDPGRRAAQADLDDLSLVVQLYSYRDDFANDSPSIERLAELVDKLEEDILKAPTASVHGARRATIRFGKPVAVPNRPNRGDRGRVQQLTETLEQAVRELLVQIKKPLAAMPRTSDHGLPRNFPTVRAI
jgi:1-acyl-sn-glycerol-3-phosphate acyltransferase